MNEIMEKTFELIDMIDSSDIVSNIDMYKKRILDNKELCDLIDKGNNSDDKYLIMDIKRKLYSNSDYKGYMDNYNKLFYIVIDINNRFSKLTNSRSCHKI